MRVVVHADSLERTGSGSITGQIYLQAGEKLFPAMGWFDFPVVILNWWLSALKRLDGQNVEFSFMDGPFHFVAIPTPTGSLMIECCERGGAPMVRTEANRYEFVESVQRAGEIILAECHRQGWADPDITALASLVRRNGA